MEGKDCWALKRQSCDLHNQMDQPQSFWYTYQTDCAALQTNKESDVNFHHRKSFSLHSIMKPAYTS